MVYPRAVDPFPLGDQPGGRGWKSCMSLLQQPALGSLGQWVGLPLHRVRYLVALGFLGSRWPDLSPRA